MTVKDLIKELEVLGGDKEVLIATDYELNNIYNTVTVELLERDNLMDTIHSVVLSPTGEIINEF